MKFLSKIFGIKQKAETETNDKFVSQSNSLETPKLKADFDLICKETIIPFFKQLGFKRISLHFARQTNNVTQCFNVQKSKWNSYNDIVTFTFNFGFYNSEISAIISDKETQLDFPKTYDCFIQNRLGMFSHNRDHWYTLSQNINATKTAEQIKADLEKYLKPMFENYTSLDTLKLFLEKDEKYISPTLSPYYLIAFYMLTDQVEKGRQTIKEQYRNAIIPQTVRDSLVLPDGTRKETVSTQINQHFIDRIKKLAEKYEVELRKTMKLAGNMWLTVSLIDRFRITRMFYIIITTILLLSCGQKKSKEDNETTKAGNISTTISTDTSKLSKIIDINVFKPTQAKFKYVFIDNSGQNERLSVPGPSDNYLEAVLYFDTATFKTLKTKYFDAVYTSPNFDKQTFNFEWLHNDVKKELMESDTNYHGHPDFFLGLGQSGKLWLLHNKILLKKSTD